MTSKNSSLKGNERASACTGNPNRANADLDVDFHGFASLVRISIAHGCAEHSLFCRPDDAGSALLFLPAEIMGQIDHRVGPDFDEGRLLHGVQESQTPVYTPGYV